MIRRSAVIATAAILLSLLMHFIGLSFTPRIQQQTSVEEGPTNVVEVGNTFEDVAETIPEPVEPESTPSPEPELVQEPTEIPTSEALVASDNPQQSVTPDTGSEQNADSDTTGPSETEVGENPDPQTVEPSGNNEGTTTEVVVTPPVEPDTATEAPESAELESVPPIEPIEPTTADPALSPPVTAAPQQLAALPDAIAPVLPVTPVLEPSTIPVIPLESETVAPETPDTTVAPTSDNLETIEAQDDLGGTEFAALTSLRPKPPERKRPERTVRKTQPTPSRTFESPLNGYKRSGIDPFNPRNNGTQSGGTGALNSRNAGNSDASNYAGRVLVQLNRVPNVRISGKGFAQVLFEIASDGTLASVSIGRSSGGWEIESAALAQVRSAAPFPPPPKGASRNLSFFYQN